MLDTAQPQTEPARTAAVDCTSGLRGHGRSCGTTYPQQVHVLLGGDSNSTLSARSGWALLGALGLTERR
jgi:hypothetical protein